MSPEESLGIRIRLEVGSCWVYSFIYCCFRDRKVIQPHGWISIMGWRQSLRCSCLSQPGPLAEGEQVHTALVLLVRGKGYGQSLLQIPPSHWNDTWKWTQTSYKVLNDFVLLRQWPKIRQRQARTRSHSFDFKVCLTSTLSHVVSLAGQYYN